MSVKGLNTSKGIVFTNAILSLNVSILLFLFLFLPASCFALPDAAYTSFTLENDAFTPDNRDRHYTNGMRLAFISDSFDEFNDENSLRWMRQMLSGMDLIGVEDYKRTVAYGLGQIMATPDDTSLIEAQPDDLPYTGLLYGFYSMNAEREARAHTLTLMLGVVGPLSMAEKAQKFIHKVSGSAKPQGWDYQLDNELAINLSYGRRYLLASYQPGDYLEIDLVGAGAAYLGNMITGANAGIALAIGAKRSFNPLSIRPDIGGRGSISLSGADSSGPFVLFGVGADYYLYSVFLDGNIYGDGPSVEKRPFVYSRFAGLGYNWLSFSAHIGWLKHTQLFEGQEKGMEYGTINFAWSH